MSKNKIAVICSEFNKNLVEDLYHSAVLEFEKYKQGIQENLSVVSQKKEAKKSTKLLQNLHFFQNQLNPSSKSLSSFKDFITNCKLEKIFVPGSGEIPLTVKWAIENKNFQAVLALGVIIRGQSSHYDFLCNVLQKALWDLQNSYSLPIIFSILMTENRAQAEERIKKGRGAESMKSLIQMIELKSSLKSTSNST